MQSFSGAMGNLNLDDIHKANLNSSAVDISDLSAGLPQRNGSQAAHADDSKQPAKHMVNIKSYCDLGRSLSSKNQMAGK